MSLIGRGTRVSRASTGRPLPYGPRAAEQTCTATGTPQPAKRSEQRWPGRWEQSVRDSAPDALSGARDQRFLRRSIASGARGGLMGMAAGLEMKSGLLRRLPCRRKVAGGLRLGERRSLPIICVNAYKTACAML